MRRWWLFTVRYYCKNIAKVMKLINNQKWTKKVFEFTHLDETRAAKVFDITIITLVILNIASVILETFITDQTWNNIFYNIEIVSIVIFSIEIFLRIYSAPHLYKDLKPSKARLKYTFSGLSLIDIVSVSYFYLPFIGIDLRNLRILRILRLFKILKLVRYVRAFDDVIKVCRRKSKQMVASLLVIVVILFASSLFLYQAEHQVQPEKFANIGNTFEWSISTLMHIDHEIKPKTNLGGFIYIFTSFMGIVIVAIPTGIIAGGFTEEKEEEEIKSEICPKCGR